MIEYYIIVIINVSHTAIIYNIMMINVSHTAIEYNIMMINVLLND